LPTLPLETESLASWMSSLSADERALELAKLAQTPAEFEALDYDWRFWARPAQLPPPGDWRTWLILAGRGFGKTRAGAEWIRACVRQGFTLCNIIAPTSDDARDVMVEGRSGIMAICPNGERPAYKASQRRLEWPNGARTLIFTADEPDRLRGKQSEKLWADEIAAWRYPDAWDQAMFGLRIGRDPQVVATTTPRPIKLIRELLAAPTTVVTRGSSYDNADNLAPDYLTQIIERFRDSRTGRQELFGEVLNDNPSALFRRDWIDETRVRTHPQLRKVVVGVDPSGGEGVENDEQGIVVAGTDANGHDGYVLADYTCKLGPAGWARRAVTAYHEYQANYVVAESNFGGDMVKHTLKMEDPDVPVRLVAASRGKAVRAQPIADLYEQRRIHHLGSLPLLEDELVEWNPDGTGPSPNRLDALVWAFSELMVTARVPMARAI